MFQQLPLMILMLPAILLSLSVHEAAHGYVAYKLGDPTAKNLGRLTLNPLKHINPFGFIAMVVFSVGWANPVPINTRNFKNPRKGMAISAAAGPISNLCLAIIFAILLKIVMIPLQLEMDAALMSSYTLTEVYETLHSNMSYTLLSLIAMMLFLGIILNVNLMVFNLIPLPPLDGSRMAYVFLPTETYFKIMQYEQYIMIGFIVLFALRVFDGPMEWFNTTVCDFLFKTLKMPENYLYVALEDLKSRLPTFSL